MRKAKFAAYPVKSYLIQKEYVCRLPQHPLFWCSSWQNNSLPGVDWDSVYCLLLLQANHGFHNPMYSISLTLLWLLQHDWGHTKSWRFYALSGSQLALVYLHKECLRSGFDFTQDPDLHSYLDCLAHLVSNSKSYRCQAFQTNLNPWHKEAPCSSGETRNPPRRQYL